MKRLPLFQSQKNNRIDAISTALILFFMNKPVYAQKTLANAKKALESLQRDLTTNIIPIAAAVILLCLAISYAGRYIEKILLCARQLMLSSLVQLLNLLKCCLAHKVSNTKCFSSRRVCVQ